MGHHKIREDKTCLNCGAYVAERFCPKCGQENSTNHPSFGYLFTHFFEDLFHYDSSFWKTIRYLIFKPGFVISEFLKGKRKSYVPPVKLYIFVSFVAFFLPFILPDFGDNSKEKLLENGIEVNGVEGIKTIAQLDSIQNSLPENNKITAIEYNVYKEILEKEKTKDPVNFNFANDSENETVNYEDYQNMKTVADFDSIHQTIKSEKKLDWFTAKLIRKTVEIKEREIFENDNFGEIFTSMLTKNFSKVLIIYLPIFAFVLWLFHSKKKWVYYDHGVFTLYYFSFLLVSITALYLIEWMLNFLIYTFPATDSYITFLEIVLYIFASLYFIFYFFRAHSKVYGERKFKSRFKALIIGFSNFILISIILGIYTLITFLIV